MAAESRAPPPHLDIDSHVVRQLGEQLITDAEQAILELIKNSYDADASLCSVVINTSAPPRTAGTGEGEIIVEDNGCGMDADTVRSAWLRISSSAKREQKASGRTGGKHERTPLGDKGLGRLGTMKLGDHIEVQTYSQSDGAGQLVAWSWNDCVSGRPLSEVTIEFREDLPSIGRTGTRLKVSGLKDIHHWRGKKQLKALQLTMSNLLSPFAPIPAFRVRLVVDGQELDFVELTKQVLASATAQFEVKWTDKTLQCRGRVKSAVFRTRKDDPDFERLVASDSGKRLKAYLEELPASIDMKLGSESKKGWFLSVERSWDWDELVSTAQAGHLGLPGPLYGELHSFNLQDLPSESSETFSALGEYRSLIKDSAKVAVYRDGFSVRMSEDWLGLGRQWTSGKSWYSLRPSSTIGHIDITARDNAQLEEKSDREGFTDTPASRAFLFLLERFVQFANDALEALRRGYGDYRKQNAERAGQLTEAWSPADAARGLREAIEISKSTIRVMGKVARREPQLERARADLLKVARKADAGTKSMVAEAIARFDDALRSWRSERNEVQVLAARIAQQEGLAEAVLGKLEQQNQQLSDVYDTVALGLSAQALAHDINELLEDLNGRTRKLVARLKGSADPQVSGYLEAVRATVSTIRKQVSFLDPMLRTARETKQQFRVSEFVRDYLEIRGERLERASIATRVEILSDYEIRMNRGRLLQVVDNLVRNSEYWLTHWSSKIAKREIVVEVQEPILRIWDSGLGIKQSYEHTLFDMFVSDKPRSEGQGLGLFIARHLLEREGCVVTLSPKRNSHGRLFQFEIDLTGVSR